MASLHLDSSGEHQGEFRFIVANLNHAPVQTFSPHAMSPFCSRLFIKGQRLERYRRRGPTRINRIEFILPSVSVHTPKSLIQRQSAMIVWPVGVFIAGTI